MAPERLLTDDEVRRANHVSKIVLEAAKVAYIGAMSPAGGVE